VAGNTGPASGHFGYGRATVVTESTVSFGALPRAIVGGVVLLLAALVLAFVLLRRARRKAAAELAAVQQSAEQLSAPNTWLGSSGD
jgi:hypothetical protein